MTPEQYKTFVATVKQYIEWDVEIDTIPQQALSGGWKEFTDFCEQDYFAEALEFLQLTEVTDDERRELEAELDIWLRAGR